MASLRKYKSVGNGVYKGPHGYYIRPWVSGKRTWRKLVATAQRTAIQEARLILSKPQHKSPVIDPLLTSYFDSNCPNSRLEPAPNENFVKNKLRHLKNIREFFGCRRVDEITIPLLHQYAIWRRNRIREGGTGSAIIDSEINLLSSVLNYAVAVGLIEANPIKAGRPKFVTRQNVTHSRERMPKNASELHLLARSLFEAGSLSVGFFVLFAAFTGCRKSELLRMRLDAPPGEPGSVDGSILHVKRSKRGVNPFIVIHEPLAALMQVHRQVIPGPWYFPATDPSKSILGTALSIQMRRQSEILQISPTITPHGLRAYYVTKRRSDGASDAQIAVEIGDQTVSLISQVYGEAPPNWQGREKLHWMPNDDPAWSVVQFVVQ